MEYQQDLGTTELLWPQCYRFLQANACGVVGQQNQKADCCRFLVSELISCRSAVLHTEHSINICFKEKSFLCRVWLSVTSGLKGHLFFCSKCSQNYCDMLIFSSSSLTTWFLHSLCEFSYGKYHENVFIHCVGKTVENCEGQEVNFSILMTACASGFIIPLCWWRQENCEDSKRILLHEPRLN